MSAKKASTTVVAAGAVVLRDADDGPEVLLVHRPRYDDWSFPKGKLLPGERPLLAAGREVLEETGLQVRLQNPLTDRHYLVEDLPKVVHYWQAQVRTDHGFESNSEVDEVAWLPVASARDRLTQPHDRELLDEVQWPPTTAVVILRHAKAVKRSRWDGSEADRPLEDVGRLEATAVADLLDAYGVTLVHSSDWVRCVQTLQPYADRHGYPVVPEPGLTEEGFEEDPTAGIGRWRGLLAETAAHREPMVLCSHRPVLPALIETMLDGTGLKGPKEPLSPGELVVGHLRDGRVEYLEAHVTRT